MNDKPNPRDVTIVDDSDDMKEAPPEFPRGSSSASRSYSCHFPYNRVSDADFLNAPLINTSNSIAYALSGSVVDPFSNLIRHLQQSNEEDKTNFFNITQLLAIGAPSYKLLPYLFSLLDSQPTTVRPRLILESIHALSINDQEFSARLLTKLDIFFKFIDKKEYVGEVLSIFLAAGSYASEEVASQLITYLSAQEANFKENIQIRGQFYSIYAILSKYPQKFPDSLVNEIIKRSNHNQNQEMRVEIVKPCLHCISAFIADPSQNAYRIVEKNVGILVGKMIFALVEAEKKGDNELILLLLKVILEVYATFKYGEVEKDFEFLLQASLISLKSFGDESIQSLAGLLLKQIDGV